MAVAAHAFADLRVLFRAPAGPRRGFGHLVRCRSLARAMRVAPVMAIRGGATALAAARRLGCQVITGSPAAAMARVAPDLLVVDDPVARDARRWIRCARRAGCRVVTIHDLGLGARDGDLVVDGSIVRPHVVRARRHCRKRGEASLSAAAGGGRHLTGPRFAILDPAFASRARVRPAPRRGVCRVLISLGGGPRAGLALRIARAIQRGCPGADIAIAGGFAARSTTAGATVAWTGPLDGLKEQFSRCDVAVVGGGVSLYEACACGVAAVAVPVVAAQRPTVRGFLLRGAAAGTTRVPAADAIARDVTRLLASRPLRARLAANGRRIVDGRGAVRVAGALLQLAASTPRAAAAAAAPPTARRPS